MSLEPQPTNPIGWLIMLLLGLAMLFASPGTSSGPAPTPERPTTGRPPVTDPRPTFPAQGVPDNAELLGIETLSVIVRESFPPQVSVEVRGHWPNGCDFEPQVATTREGDRVIVAIFRIVPPGTMCTMVMQPYRTAVDISEAFMENGEFRFGDYVIEVNGSTTSVSF